MAHDADRNVELRLRAAVDSAPSGLLMLDPNGRIVLVNRECERLFGYCREELLGQPVEMLVPERFRAGHSAHRAGFLATPRARAMGEGRDLFGLRKDGSEVPVEIGLTPVATEEGLFVLSSVVDISARKRAEEHFRVAVESSPNGMVMVDADGRIVLVNREVERLFGYGREELLGTSIDRLVPERFRDAHPGYRADFFHNPGTRAMGEGRDLYGLTKDGNEVPVEIGLNPIETDEGTFVLSSIVDISARVAAEQEKQKLEEQLLQSQKMEALGTLAGGVAHDFNNILGGILGYAELLEESVEGRGHRSDLRELIGFAQRGKEVVEQILSFSRNREPERKAFALDEIVRDVTRLLRPSVGPDVEIHVELDSDLPRVYADPAGIHQVLVNLGMNAAHAMPDGGILEFRAEKRYVIDNVARRHPYLSEGMHAFITVRDTGEGMDADVQARALEPFFTTKAAGSGSGLGLSIVHSIIRENGGALEMESKVGTGTTIGCFLPVQEVEEISEVAVAAVVEPDLSGKRILLVDDEPSLARVGERRLAYLGYLPTVTSNSSEALELIRKDPGAFDAVITDYLMPGMDGLELAREIRNLRPDLPVLMFTGYVHGLEDTSVRDAGIAALLQKPASLAELQQALHEVFSDDGGGEKPLH